MKIWKIFVGFFLVLAAIFILLDATGVISPIESVIGEVSVFAVIVGIFLLAFAISSIARGKINEIFFPLAFIFMLFEKNVAFVCGIEDSNFVHNGIVLLCALLLTIGVGMLMPKRLRKMKNRKGRCLGRGIGSSTVYIDCSDFTEEEVENNMGSCTVYFENVDKYESGGTLTVDNNMGSMVICVPSAWRIKIRVDNNMGSISLPESCAESGPVLIIDGDNNMGSLTIEYV